MGQGLVNRPREPGTPIGEGVPPHPTFAEVYETYFTFVWRSARRLGTPEPNLDDVVQEIFMVAFRRGDEFEGRSSVKTWLYGIVFNVVRAHRRDLARRHPQMLAGDRRVDTDLLVDVADGPHEQLSKSEAARIVDGFLDGLDDDRRAVFVLAEMEQLTAPEIAAIVGAPLNTVYSRLRLARIDFEKAITRYRARDARGAT